MPVVRVRYRHTQRRRGVCCATACERVRLTPHACTLPTPRTRLPAHLPPPPTANVARCCAFSTAWVSAFAYLLPHCDRDYSMGRRHAHCSHACLCSSITRTFTATHGGLPFPTGHRGRADACGRWLNISGEQQTNRTALVCAHAAANARAYTTTSAVATGRFTHTPHYPAPPPAPPPHPPHTRLTPLTPPFTGRFFPLVRTLPTLYSHSYRGPCIDAVQARAAA